MVSPGCELAEREYRKSLRQAVLVNTNPATPQVFSSIQSLLHASKQAAVVLCSDLHQEVVPAAVSFCKRHSAFLLTDNAFTDSSLSLAVKQAGFISASLGELRSGISQVICCGKDSLQMLPRLKEFLPVLGSGNVQILPESNPLDTLQNLRLETLTNKTKNANLAQGAVDLPGLVLFDRNWLQEDLHIATELLLWLAELNQGQRWYALYIPSAPNSMGICNALLASAGCPGSMLFSAEGIGYNPRMFQMQQLVENGWVDTCIIAGNPDLLPASVLTSLERINTILLSPVPPDWKPAISIPVARAGVDCTGIMQRLDHIPLPLFPLVRTSRLTIEEVLTTLTVGIPT